MKIFVLFAVLFFTLRVFSQSFNYYYIDEYIRAQNDPEYTEYLKQKQADADSFKQGIEEYKDQKFFDEQMQEQARIEYSEYKKNKKEYDSSQDYKKYEKEKELEQKKFLELQSQYAFEKEDQNITPQNYWRKNQRSIASFEERKRVPKKDRLFKSKKQK
jgi:hypothetical protein